MVHQEKYDKPAILLHWLMVLLIFTLFGLGWYMTDLPKGSPERTWFFTLHKSVGLTVAMLAVFRLGWRLFRDVPALPDSIPAWDKALAKLTHRVLYLLMFVQPASGYISSCFSGYATSFWGIPLPQWGWKDPELNELFTEIHEVSSIALLCLIFLHVSGVLYNQFIKHNDILTRMRPF